jgi:two-component system NtrC family sensor kinase
MNKRDKLIRRFFSLKFRLMAFITVVLVLVVGIPGGFFIHILDKNYLEFSENMIEATSQVVYQFIFDAMMENDPEGIQAQIKLISMIEPINLLRIYRPKGEILFSSRKDEIHQNIKDLPPEVSFFEETAGEIEAFKRVGNIFSHHHPIYVQQECAGCHKNVGSLIAILDIHTGFTPAEQLYIRSKKLVIFGSVFIIVILWLLINLIYQTQVESKLKTIISGFEKVSTSNLDFKIDLPGKDELAYLAKKFNEMVHRLKESLQKGDKLLMEKLERADRLVTLGEVAAEIAHEVNNPAGIILTRAEFLKDEIEEQNKNSAFEEDLDMIIQQTKKIAEITKSILYYAKKLPKTFSKTDLNEVITQSIKILEPRIKKSNVMIKVTSDEKPSEIMGNFPQLEQVFCNLINNSLDVLNHQNNNIEFLIQKKPRKNKNDVYQITYTDSGPGIPKEYEDQIFNPFFTTKGAEKGTGLGLFIARNIILNHHGSIQLTNNSKGGVKFILEFEACHE